MSGFSLKIENISKSFRLPHERHNSLKQTALQWHKRKFEKLTVLKDISFEIKEGEFFGIVGRNGSGKSTLLKLIAGIYQPTKGSITINGKLTPFIELGVGFNMELTGKDNVFLNGAILGLTKKEVRAKYDEIVSFAELHKFMDQKLKNYSSGMLVRLAFSIAIQAQNDILLIDEVLAVGDANFQQKCFDHFRYIKDQGTTVIFVSHSMASIKEFCDRAMLISEGKIVGIGEPLKIAAQYDALNQIETDKNTKKRNKAIRNNTKLGVMIKNKHGVRATSFNIGEQLTVEFELPADYGVENLGVGIVRDGGEYVFGTNTIGEKIKRPITTGNLSYSLKLDISPGRYYLIFGSFGKTRFEVLEFVTEGPSFIVKDDINKEWEGLVHLNHKWHS